MFDLPLMSGQFHSTAHSHKHLYFWSPEKRMNERLDQFLLVYLNVIDCGSKFKQIFRKYFMKGERFAKVILLHLEMCSLNGQWWCCQCRPNWSNFIPINWHSTWFCCATTFSIHFYFQIVWIMEFAPARFLFMLFGQSEAILPSVWAYIWAPQSFKQFNTLTLGPTAKYAEINETPLLNFPPTIYFPWTITMAKFF